LEPVESLFLGVIPLEGFSGGEILANVFPAVAVFSLGVDFVEPISGLSESSPGALFRGCYGAGGPVELGGLLSEILEFEFVLTSA